LDLAVRRSPSPHVRHPPSFSRYPPPLSRLPSPTRRSSDLLPESDPDVAVTVFVPAVVLRVHDVRAAIPSVPVLTGVVGVTVPLRSEEHTSELQAPDHIVCRLLLEKKHQRRARSQRPRAARS